MHPSIYVYFFFKYNANALNVNVSMSKKLLACTMEIKFKQNRFSEL